MQRITTPSTMMRRLSPYLCFISLASAAWTNQPNRFAGTLLPGTMLVGKSSRSSETKMTSESIEGKSIRRLSLSGVSVSSEGFWVFFQVPASFKDDKVQTLPLQVTSDPQDMVAATSAESLTLIQLISGVDMAGPILPPEVLGQTTALFCETLEDADGEEAVCKKQILEFMKDSLPKNAPSLYSECNIWQRSKVKLPKVSIDQVYLQTALSDKEGWVYECSIPEIGKMDVRPSIDIFQEVSFAFNERVSPAFISVALALRYKAPISLENCGGSLQLLDNVELQDKFPLFRTVESLKDQSTRVQRNIERGFEVHKLTGALRISMEKGDEEAVRTIRKELDRYDSMDELPTLGSDTDFGLDELQ